ncbi:PLC-like phosphodiesterase [Ceratobasidium sp. AG-I]|nr:PLC-like phosphodiesterase [Ceratobasidium sp. AG-I]
MLEKPQSKRATVCNGYSELCSKTYGNVTYIGAHNSYAVGSNNLAANQDYDVTQQLKDGIRLLQLQAHLQNGAIRLCHSSCLLLDGGLLSDYLKKVKTWLDANANEVVSILIVNIDNQPAASFAAAYQTANMVDLSYAPETVAVTADQWPTLGTLIDTGKRVVSFMDNGADASAAPYLIDEFSNIWETAFDVTDPSFPCTLNRTAGTADGKLGLSNHFLDTYASIVGVQSLVPDKASLNTTNAASGAGSLGEEAKTCLALNNKQQTFFLVDYYNYGLGSVFEVAASANGVTYDSTKTIAPPITSTGGTSSSSSASAGTANAAMSLQALSMGWSWTGAVVAVGAVVGGAIAL